MADMNARGDALRAALNARLAAAAADWCFAGTGSVMALHRGRTPPTRYVRDALADGVRALLHMYLLQCGFWTGRRGMVVLSTRTDDAMCARLESAVGDWARHYAALLGADA
jgi:glutamate-1-semialdehyde aminotransferase